MKSFPQVSTPPWPADDQPRARKDTVIFLVELPEAFHKVAWKTAQQVFSEAQVIIVRTVKEARQRATSGSRQLLVLTDQNEAEVGQATQATDENDMPLWATLVLGRSSSDLVESLPLEECTPQILARLFRAALMQHELLRENLQLRGDLKTLARRLNHDLRSPLNCLHLNCELLDELVNKDAPVARKQLEVIQRSLSEITDLVERFSVVLKASAEPTAATELRMDEIVAGVLAQLEDIIIQNGITIQQPANWPVVKGVASWLNVIWHCLLTNALKHNERLAPIQVGWSEQDGAVRFWVANRGAPVRPEMEAGLFTPFDRLHTHTRHGFGLCLVQRLVSLQGGACGYERRGDRSVFYFTLPAMLPHTFAVAEPARQSASV